MTRTQFANDPKFDTQAMPEMRPGCGRPGLVPVEVLLRSFLIVEPGPSWWVSKSRYSSHIVTRFIAWICWPVSAGSKELL